MKTQKTTRKLFILLAVITMLAALSFPVSAKTYKAKNVTAKQITTELKKTIGIKDITVVIKKTSGSQIGKPNGYKSKTNFFDKMYPNLYCSIEVFSSSNLAYRRAGYLAALQEIYAASGVARDVPYVTYIHKNVLIRLNGHMPKSYEKKYVRAVKKIVK